MRYLILLPPVRNHNIVRRELHCDEDITTIPKNQKDILVDIPKRVNDIYLHDVDANGFKVKTINTIIDGNKRDSQQVEPGVIGYKPIDKGAKVPEKPLKDELKSETRFEPKKTFGVRKDERE